MHIYPPPPPPTPQVYKSRQLMETLDCSYILRRAEIDAVVYYINNFNNNELFCC